MKLLLTGAGGFLGRHVLAALTRSGIPTVAAGRRPVAGVPFLQADLLELRDFAGLIAEVEPTHLLHLAWYAEHGRYWTSPLNLRWVEATLRLTEAFCAAGGRRLVAAGSCAEYDWSAGYCREDGTPAVPATLYGTAKDATRRLVQALCAQSGVGWAWARIFLPFGPGEPRERLIPSLADCLSGRRPPFGVDAEAYRDFLHASDLAEGLVTLLQAEDSGLYNVCSGRPVQLADLVGRIARLCGGDPGPVLGLSAPRPGEPRLLVGDNTRLKSLGWQPALSLDEGLAQCLAEGRR